MARGYSALGREVQSCTCIPHWEKKYNLARILHIYWALEKEVQSCTYIVHCGKKYNLAHILRIGDNKKNMKGWDYSQPRNGDYHLREST